MDSTASTLSSTSMTRIPAGGASAGVVEVSDMRLGARSVAAPGTLPVPDYVSRGHPTELPGDVYLLSYMRNSCRPTAPAARAVHTRNDSTISGDRNGHDDGGGMQRSG